MFSKRLRVLFLALSGPADLPYELGPSKGWRGRLHIGADRVVDLAVGMSDPAERIDSRVSAFGSGASRSTSNRHF